MAITKEELQSFSATDEGRAVLTEIGFIHGDQHKSIVDETTKGLAENKARLLAEKKQLEEKFKGILPKAEAVDKLSNILKSHEIVLDENGNFNFDTLEDLIVKGKSGGSGDATELTKNLTKTQREKRDLELEFNKFKNQHEEVGKNLNIANQFIEKLLVEDSILKELQKLDDIPKELFDSLTIVLKQRSGAYVEVDTENPSIRRAVTKEGDSIARFIELWKETPEGKTFRRAPQNTGGGSNHSGSNHSKGKEMLRSEFDTLPPAQQREFFKSGGKLRD
jgi:hypothetical protein